MYKRQHKNHEAIGRWHNKGARRVEQKKVSDSSNHTWEDRKYYTFEELVADEILGLPVSGILSASKMCIRDRGGVW